MADDEHDELEVNYIYTVKHLILNLDSSTDLQEIQSRIHRISCERHLFGSLLGNLCLRKFNSCNVSTQSNHKYLRRPTLSRIPLVIQTKLHYLSQIQLFVWHSKFSIYIIRNVLNLDLQRLLNCIFIILDHFT